jgi:uncharacterized metal-binding protein
MPQGKVHAANSIGTAAIILVGGYCGSFYFVEVAGTFLGCVLGIFLSPDLDVNRGYIGDSLLRKVPYIGWLLSLVWWAYWRPYALIVPHRSSFSHLPVWGTFWRYLIFSIPVWVVWYFYTFQISWNWVLFVFVGLCISDFQHAVADFFEPDVEE